jgi:hypothetical protein
VLIATDPTLSPRLAPRPHTPADWIGTWRSELGDELALEPGGVAQRGGARLVWCVHLGRFTTVFFGPAVAPRRDGWLVRARRGEEIEVASADGTTSVERWVRSPEGTR